MQSWSNQDLTSANHSGDFFCPHCKTGSFEVIGVERHIGETEQTRCALVMRCLVCLAPFWHVAETESFSLAEPAAAAAHLQVDLPEPSRNRETAAPSTHQARRRST
jgi:hypothetical protein